MEKEGWLRYRRTVKKRLERKEKDQFTLQEDPERPGLGGCLSKNVEFVSWA